MYIVAGLGNPGLKYRHTRHNTGFDAIDTMAKALGCDVKKDECRAKTGSSIIAGQKVLLVKPQTFMNLSGESLQALCAYYKVNPEEGLIVISDDIALPAGSPCRPGKSESATRARPAATTDSKTSSKTAGLKTSSACGSGSAPCRQART